MIKNFNSLPILTYRFFFSLNNSSKVVQVNHSTFACRMAISPFQVSIYTQNSHKIEKDSYIHKNSFMCVNILQYDFHEPYSFESPNIGGTVFFLRAKISPYNFNLTILVSTPTKLSIKRNPLFDDSSLVQISHYAQEYM